MRNKMQKRLFQSDNFTFSGLNGFELEKLIICENPETKNPIAVYIKVEKNNWYRFFLEADFNFGVLEKEGLDVDVADTSYDFIDYTPKLKLYGQVIETIYCVSENDNCKIVVGFVSGKNFVLRTTNFDFADSEFVME